MSEKVYLVREGRISDGSDDGDRNFEERSDQGNASGNNGIIADVDEIDNNTEIGETVGPSEEMNKEETDVFEEETSGKYSKS